MPANSSSSPSNVITHAEQCMPLTLNTCFAISFSSGELEVTAVHAHRAGVSQVPVGGASRNVDRDLAGLRQGPLKPDRRDYESPCATGRAIADDSQADRLAGWRLDQVWGVAGVVDPDRDCSVGVRLSCDLWRTAAGLGQRHRSR